MYLENVVFDAVDPQRLGRFWEAAIGGQRLTDEPDGFETRLDVEGGPVLDLCFQRVPEARSVPPRLRVDLSGGTGQAQVVDRLLEVGANRPHIDPGGGADVVLADPEGNPFCVTDDLTAPAGRGPISALVFDSADPDRDLAFWSWLTGWTQTPDGAPPSLRHASGRGPVLHLSRENARKSAAKNRLHLDVRLQAAEDPDDISADIAERGGQRLVHPEWGELPWRSYTDPSGNEFCVLPARR